MCNYCESILTEKEFKDSLGKEKVDLSNGKRLITLDCSLTKICIKSNGKTKTIPGINVNAWLFDGEYDVFNMDIPVHYCPMCGEKLD